MWGEDAAEYPRGSTFLGYLSGIAVASRLVELLYSYVTLPVFRTG